MRESFALGGAHRKGFALRIAHGLAGASAMRIAALILAAALLGACGTFHATSDPASDAPEARAVSARRVPGYASYAEALVAWRRPEDVNDWIGAEFRYDVERAVALSESQRAGTPEPGIIEPDAFYVRPDGVCVDLARFAVETLQSVSPAVKARYLMIEFDPAHLRGQVLRRHWVAVYEDVEGIKVIADSKRPGVIAGPYPSIEAFLADYAAYRGRAIVSHRETASYRKQPKVQGRRMKSAP